MPSILLLYRPTFFPDLFLASISDPTVALELPLFGNRVIHLKSKNAYGRCCNIFGRCIASLRYGFQVLTLMACGVFMVDAVKFQS